jgi:hypothetical protein
MPDISTVDLAKTLLDKRFKLGTPGVRRQSPVQMAERLANVAEGQWQLNVPIEIGHGPTFSPGLVGRSIEPVS